MNQISPPVSFITLAMHHAERSEWPVARALLEYAVNIPRDRQAARLLLWEVCQVLGDAEAGVAHLRAAVTEMPLTFRPAKHPRRRVLVINVVGDFQANLPVAMLLDDITTEVHTLWLQPRVPVSDLLPEPDFLPEIDCVFIAIAEDQRHAEILRAADLLAARLGKPLINPGHLIAATGRDQMAALLRDIPNAIVPRQTLGLAQDLLTGCAFPLIIRPRHSHAGTGLARIDDAVALASYLRPFQPSDLFFVAPFIDYRSADGAWRKYRIIFVDGQPMPFHMAIHDDWAVWYYNAGMDRDAGKRAEENAFLNDFGHAFPPGAIFALREIAARVGLAYFGLDCGLMPDGTLVVFEVETGMIVHDRPEGEVFAYRLAPARRILAAVTALIDARIASRSSVS